MNKMIVQRNTSLKSYFGNQNIKKGLKRYHNTDFYRKLHLQKLKIPKFKLSRTLVCTPYYILLISVEAHHTT